MVTTAKKVARSIGLLSASAVALAALAACAHHDSPTVPSLGGTGAPTAPAASGAGGAKGGDGKDYTPTGAGPTGEARRQALHAAAECIRQHGIPTYQEPVLTADGHVYTDARSMQDASDDTLHAVQDACKQLIDAAQFEPDQQAPAPPALVQAGVKAAECLRANGLPNVKDPTSSTRFTPGHGFGLSRDELPGDKTDPTVQRAFQACRALLDQETRQSSLGSLGSAHA